MKRKRIKVHSSAAVNKRKKKIKNKLKKSGIKTLEQVLHTGELSKEEKIQHIRHIYTCYNARTKTFHKNNVGLSLRNELNAYIYELVEGKHTIAEFEVFKKQLNEKLNAIEAEDKNEQLNRAENLSPELTKDWELIKGSKKAAIVILDPTSLKEYVNFSAKEKLSLKRMSFSVKEDASDKYKLEMCKKFLAKEKEQWKVAYKDLAKNHTQHINHYLVEMYLENRDKTIYPENFSDLDFRTLSEIVGLAKKWLYEKFEGDMRQYDKFIEETLPHWIESGMQGHHDLILEKIEKNLN